MSDETTVPKSIVDRIRKLLKLGESDNPNEAAAAMGQAQRLLDQHRLTTDSIGAEEEEISVGNDHPLEHMTRRCPWRGQLAAGIAESNGCLMTWNFPWNPARGRCDAVIVLIGRPSDVMVSLYMYQFASREVFRLSKLHVEGKGRGRAYINSFRRACVHSIVKKVRAHRDVGADGDRYAIVALSQLEKATAFADELGMKEATALKDGDLTPQAVREGIAAGEGVVIHDGITSGRRERALGTGS